MINKSVTCRGTFMKHIHHIIPRHMGGTDDPSNLVELTVAEHAQAHKELYEKYGKKEDLCAYYMLSGRNQDPEFVKARASLGGRAAAKARWAKGEPWGFAVMDKKQLFEIASAIGKIQGKRNAESGHMQRIRKMVDLSAAGKKGGATTMARGKGSFADPVERLKSASKGGKTQGKRNAESGHLKRIAQLPNPRTEGKQWITNGTDNKMITKGDVIPEGYRAGKTQKK